MEFFVGLMIVIIVAVLALPWMAIMLFPFILLALGFLLVSSKEFSGKELIPIQKKVGRKNRALLIDDDPPSLHVIQDYLRNLQYELEVVADPQKAALSLFRGDYDLVILDNDLHELSGAQVLKQADYFIDSAIDEESPMLSRVVPVIGYTAHANVDWNFSSLVHFNVLGTFSKRAPPSVIKKELDRSLCYGK